MNTNSITNAFEQIQNKSIELYVTFSNDFKDSFVSVTSWTLGWAAIVLIHLMTIPTLISLMSGVTDQVPPVDIVLIAWLSLALLFIKATLEKDVINILTIGLGFIGQAVFIALIFFK